MLLGYFRESKVPGLIMGKLTACAAQKRGATEIICKMLDKQESSHDNANATYPKDGDEEE